MVTRRRVVKAALTIPVLAYTFDSTQLVAQERMGRARSGGFYVMQFGTFKLVALKDGVQMIPFDKSLTRTTAERVRSRLHRNILHRRCLRRRMRR